MTSTDSGVLVKVEDTVTSEKAANAMMSFFNEHAGDNGQHWPTVEDALAWLGVDDE